LERGVTTIATSSEFGPPGNTAVINDAGQVAFFAKFLGASCGGLVVANVREAHYVVNPTGSLCAPVADPTMNNRGTMAFGFCHVNATCFVQTVTRNGDVPPLSVALGFRVQR
jgi:hypothetical protein